MISPDSIHIFLYFLTLWKLSNHLSLHDKPCKWILGVDKNYYTTYIPEICRDFGLAASWKCLELDPRSTPNKPKKWSENLNPPKKYMVDVSGVFFLGVSDCLANRCFLPESSGSVLCAWRLGVFSFLKTLYHRDLSIFLKFPFPKGEIFSSSKHWVFNMFQLFQGGFLWREKHSQGWTEMVPVVELPCHPTCSESMRSQSQSCQLLWRQRKP